MVIRDEDMKKEQRPNLRGGDGAAEFLHVVPEGFMPPACRLFSVITLEKGCGIGRHEHIAEAEIYYVLEGEGVINDNGMIRQIKKGDSSICGGGDFHSVANEKDEPLKILAAIIKE